MSDVNRYDVAVEYIGDGEYAGKMEAHEYGDYVAFDDYQDLEDEKKDLEVKLVILERKVRDLLDEF